jgi:hypothetical protein
MKAKAQEQLDRFCGGDEDTHRFDFTRAMAAETITEFDDAFIAPIYGFTDCWDYYRKTSSIYVLQDVKVPTYILNASDGTWHVLCFEICVVQRLTSLAYTKYAIPSTAQIHSSTLQSFPSKRPLPTAAPRPSSCDKLIRAVIWDSASTKLRRTIPGSPMTP